MRLDIKFSVIILLFMSLDSCKMSKVLGLPLAEARHRLEKGDIGFILEAEFPKHSAGRAEAGEGSVPDDFYEALALFQPITRIHSQAPFFAGLLTEAAEEPGNTKKSSLLFILALKNPSPLIRREAGQKLLLPVLEGKDDFSRTLALETLARISSDTEDEVLKDLHAACLYRLGRFSEAMAFCEDQDQMETFSSWKEALYLLSSWNSNTVDENFYKRTAAFFLTQPVDTCWHWALNEFAGAEFFRPEETAAFMGRAAAARSAYVQSLMCFNLVLALNEELFFEYPELINSLGRAFQFSSAEARKQGLEIFGAWEKRLAANPDEAQRSLRYLLPYYSGRIERQQEQFRKSSESFSRALIYAPDSLQSDACIWYILMNALRENPKTAADYFKTYIPRMSSYPYFNDVLGRLSQYLVSQKDWKTLEEIYRLLQAERAGGIIAQYAWILGRAIQEKYYYVMLDPKDLFKTAFNEGKGSIYYRAMSALQLGVPFIPAEDSESSKPGKNPKPGPEHVAEALNQRFGQSRGSTPEMEFLTGFFRFGAASLASPYIKNYEANLTFPELRLLARSLADSGLADESLNFISRYMARDDYQISREDLELYYPRHFQKLIEDNARNAGLGPELLFALIRTESYFQSDAVSRSGAIGLCQLMPDTAQDMANRLARRGGPDYRNAGGIDLKDPEINIHLGAFYLDYLVEQMGNPMTALLAYNGGLGRVRRWRRAADLPDDIFLETVEFEETREYGRKVLAAAAVYGYLYYGMSMDEVIADIYRGN